MTHATIKPSGAGQCYVEFPYNAKLNAAMESLPGATFHNHGWLVATMQLPALKRIFATLTVDPAVVADYHRRLRAMLEDFAGAGLTVYLVGSQVRSQCLRKGELGRHLGEAIEAHRAGIVAVLKQGPIVARVVERPVIQPGPAVIELAAEIEPDSGIEGSMLKGVRNAKKNQGKKQAIGKAVRRRKQPA
ncbi:MAG: hypothetical protein E6Q97_29700 [Desulfurellales bacterium]|nr:MAG: hypothetical protein E6Q97_29700 [Desulfurellales bacterium]